MKQKDNRRPGFGRAAAAFGLVIAGVWSAGFFGNQSQPTHRTVAPEETYRLVHAIGNTERINAHGLTKRDCEARKRDTLAVALALGTGGSITCLPDNLFDD